MDKSGQAPRAKTDRLKTGPQQQSQTRLPKPDADPAAAAATLDRVPLGTSPPPDSSAIIALQRTVGNRAVQRFIGPGAGVGSRTRARPVRPLPVPPTRPAISRDQALPGLAPATLQREPGPQTGSGTGAKRSVELKIEKGRFSIALEISAVGAAPSPLTGQVGGRETQLLPTEMKTVKTAGQKAALSWALALTNVTTKKGKLRGTGLEYALDVKAMEAEVSADEVKVTLAQVTFALKGETFLQGLKFAVEGKIAVSVTPQDAVRLGRMLRLQGAIRKNTAAYLKAKRKLAALQDLQRKLNKKVRNSRGRARKRLLRRRKAIAKKIGQLSKKIAQNKAATAQLRGSYKVAQAGLKSGAGRLAGKAAAKAGAKLLGKLVAKLVPGLNVALAVVDIVQVASTIYKMSNGQLGLGPEGSGKGSGQGGGAQGAAGGQGGGAKGAPGGAGTKLPPDVDITEDVKYEPLTGTSGTPPGKEPKLHGTARAVWAVLKGTVGKGVVCTADDIAQLNDLVPKKLDTDQQQALLKLLQSARGRRAANAFEVLAQVEQLVREVTHPTPSATLKEPGRQAVDITPPKDKREAERKRKEAERKKKASLVPLVAWLKRNKARVTAGGPYYEFQMTRKALNLLTKDSRITGKFAMQARTGEILAGYTLAVVLKKVRSKDGTVKVTFTRLRTTMYDETGTRRSDSPEIIHTLSFRQY